MKNFSRVVSLIIFIIFVSLIFATNQEIQTNEQVKNNTIEEFDLRWEYKKQSSSDCWSSPAIGSDGSIYVAVGYEHEYSLELAHGEVYALNSDGTLKWKFSIGGTIEQYPMRISSSPAIGQDGTIYVGSENYNLYAFNPDGSVKWTFETKNEIRNSPSIGADGTIYFGSLDDYVYAVNPNGTLKWKYDTNGSIYYSSAAIGEDGTIYIGNYDDYLLAINPDGTLKWKFETQGWIDSSPSIGADGTIYFGSWDDYLYALNPDGTLRWKYKTGRNVKSSPTIGTDGAIYVGSDDDYLYALNPDGTLRWKYKTGRNVKSSPAIGKNGTIYFSSCDTRFYALNPDGTLKWEFSAGWSFSSPAIDDNGNIYINGNLYIFSIKDDNNGLANSSWPMFKRDIEHSGKVKTEKNGIISLIDMRPFNYEQNLSIDTTINWTSDKLGKNNLSYNIYFGKTENPSLVKKNVEMTKYDPGILEYATNYYWKISINYPDGSTIEGPLYKFKTTRKKWEFVTNDNSHSSPAVGVNGTIYFGSDDNNLYAVNPDGTLKWKYKTGGCIRSSPTIGKDNVIYFGSDDNYLYAINFDGSHRWRFKTEGFIRSSPAIGRDGTVYFGSIDGCFYALNNNGQLRWKYETKNWIESSPSISSDGTIYVGNDGGYLWAFDPDGFVKWKFKTERRIITSPAIDDEGNVYVVSDYHYLYAINPNGSEKWKFKTERSLFVSSPVLGGNSVIYVGGYKEHLYAVDKTGNLKWKFEAKSPIISASAVSKDGSVYFGSSYGFLYVLDKDGKLKEKYEAGYGNSSSVVICEKNCVYITSGKKLFAFFSNFNELSDSSWPMFQQNVFHSGRKDITNVATDVKIELYPYNNQENLAVNVILKWSFENLGDEILYYHVYFGENRSPKLVNIGSKNCEYFPGLLKNNTTYYWKIGAVTKNKIVYSNTYEFRTLSKENFTKEPIRMVLVKGGSNFNKDVYIYPPKNGNYPKNRINYDYYIGKYEVTFSEYDKFCDDTGKVKPDDEGWGRGLHPVINVSWWDAIEYCNWLSEKEGLPRAYDENGNLLNSQGETTTKITEVLGYRLPTDNEWCYAGEGGHSSSSVSFTVYQVSWVKHNSGNHTHEVGERPPNAIGLFDILGNVWEWCNDLYSEGVREIHGAGWETHHYFYISTLTNIGSDEMSKEDSKGFRIAKTKTPVTKVSESKRVENSEKFYLFKNEYPLNNNRQVSAEASLSWNFIMDSDFTANESNVTYDIFLGIDNNPPKINENHEVNEFIPSILAEDATYYWKVIAENERGLSAGSPIWKFTTTSDRLLWKLCTNDIADVDNENMSSITRKLKSTITTSPLIGNDGTIYFGTTCHTTIYSGSNYYTQPNRLYAIKPNGTFKWKVDIGNDNFLSPIIDKNGVIYLGCESGRLYAINPDGTIKWKYKIDSEISSAPVLGKDETLYVGDNNGYLYSFSAGGTLINKTLVASEAINGIAINDNNEFYVTSEDYKIYALDSDKKVRWSFLTGREIIYAPILGKNEKENIYFSSRDGYLYALNYEGILLWDFKLSLWTKSSPVIAENGTLYVFKGITLYALNPDSTIKWKYKADEKMPLVPLPVIGQDGSVYFVSDKGALYALSKEGKLKWKYGDYVKFSPGISESGDVYFNTKTCIYKLDSKE